jgi:hypothetical protein
LDSKDVSRRAHHPVCACHHSLEHIMQRPSVEELAGGGL